MLFKFFVNFKYKVIVIVLVVVLCNLMVVKFGSFMDNELVFFRVVRYYWNMFVIVWLVDV